MRKKDKENLVAIFETLLQVINSLLVKQSNCWGYDKICIGKCENAWICASLSSVEEKLNKL
ncbi:MAG: hypothetical protein GYA36_21370 [Veillonellaceae bacterium]|nr:hypothetical protein [Veillonellaceae bacterium]